MKKLKQKIETRFLLWRKSVFLFCSSVVVELTPFRWQLVVPVGWPELKHLNFVVDWFKPVCCIHKSGRGMRESGSVDLSGEVPSRHPP